MENSRRFIVTKTVPEDPRYDATYPGAEVHYGDEVKRKIGRDAEHDGAAGYVDQRWTDRQTTNR